MNLYKYILFSFILTIFISCKEKNQNAVIKKTKLNQIVVISVNAPEKYIHLLKQDSIGKKLKDSLGSRVIGFNKGFTYLDHMNNVQNWIPKPNVSDTITIETHNDYVELCTNNFFTAIKETFLIKNGDTVIFNYENDIPKGKVINREVNDVELNYNSYRLKKLFNNKYTSHLLVYGSLALYDESEEEFEQTSIKNYIQAKQDFKREVHLLDSLKDNNLISKTNYLYRLDALNMLMEKPKKLKNIKKWMKQNKSLNNLEKMEEVYGFDLAQTDSLMKFSFFRDYLKDISQYDLPIIQKIYGNYSGFYYKDSRIRFDSILKDKRFNQTAKNFLLFDAYNEIGENFRVKDRKKYFKKLQESTTNIEYLNKLKKDYKLDFSKSNQLILTNLKNDTLTYRNLLENNKGKWLYIDFWASWCRSCRKTMPESNKLKKEFKGKNIEFIYLSLNDKKEKWKKAIELDKISDSQNYFIENGNTSKVIEDLLVRTIPHYLIYNPKGELVNGYANRPGRGAKEQLRKLMMDK